MKESLNIKHTVFALLAVFRTS